MKRKFLLSLTPRDRERINTLARATNGNQTLAIRAAIALAAGAEDAFMRDAILSVLKESRPERKRKPKGE